jgi:hypothetical protein
MKLINMMIVMKMIMMPTCKNAWMAKGMKWHFLVLRSAPKTWVVDGNLGLW